MIEIPFQKWTNAGTYLWTYRGDVHAVTHYATALSERAVGAPGSGPRFPASSKSRANLNSFLLQVEAEFGLCVVLLTSQQCRKIIENFSRLFKWEVQERFKWTMGRYHWLEIVFIPFAFKNPQSNLKKSSYPPRFFFYSLQYCIVYRPKHWATGVVFLKEQNKYTYCL